MVDDVAILQQIYHLTLSAQNAALILPLAMFLACLALNDFLLAFGHSGIVRNKYPFGQPGCNHPHLHLPIILRPFALELLVVFDEEVNESFLDEMARTSNTFILAKDASAADVRSFMNKVNNLLKTYKSPGQKKPKSRFTPEDMDRLTSVLKKANFTSKEVLDAIEGWNNSAQANTFLKVLQDKGYILITSELKKFSKPERDPNAPETRGRKKKVKDEDGEDDKKKDKEPTDAQIKKAAKKAGLDENDRFLNEFLKGKDIKKK